MPQYSKTAWVDGSAPAISAANLNKLEQGVFDAIRQDGSTTMSAQLVTIAGTAATPAIAPTGDSNTGIFFPAADTIAFGEGGTEAMRITSAGNVGIGTISPDVGSTGNKVLTVTGTFTRGRIQLQNTDGGVSAVAGTVQFLNGSNDIGSITATSDSGSGSTGFLTFTTNLTERMRITSAGNVGIGTTSPSAKLTVQDASDAKIYSTRTSGATAMLEGGGSAGYLKTTTNHAFVFGTNGADNMVLTTAGYLLIGYASSNGAYPLQVNGQIFATSSTIATSDGRYKKDIVSLDGALDIVAALNPVQFNWKEHPVHKFNTDVPTIGFIAQEVAEVLKDKAYLTSVIKKSECTWETETGETVEREVTRDVEKQVEREVIEEVDGEEIARTITETVIEQVTEIVTEPVKETHTEEFFGIAESNMIAILTKAIQELNAKVEALQAQLAK
jgi:hypothetical protein